MDYVSYYDSPLGKLTLASDGTALIGLWFDGQKHDCSVLSKECVVADLPVFREARRWLDIYFDGEIPDFTPEIFIRKDGLIKEVVNTLLHIPYGSTVTYGEIAITIKDSRKTGEKTSPRAVGAAVGRNPVSVMVPCHRVIGKNGYLVGYAGGLDRKAWLLRLETGRERPFLFKRDT